MSKQQPNQLKIMFWLVYYATRASLRNLSGYFFSLIFPLVFVAIFGAIGNSTTSITLGVENNLNQQTLIYQAINAVAKEKDSPVSLKKGSQNYLNNQLGASKINAILENSDTPNAVKLVTTTGNPQGAAAAMTFLNGILSQLNLKAAGVVRPTFSLETVDVAHKTYNYIDFILPGMIGFSLLSIATFSIAFPLITMRKTLVLKRIFATPTRPLTFVVSQCLSRSIQALLQVTVILIVGVSWFHFSLAHGLTTALEMFSLALVGVLAFLGFGIFISNLVKDEDSLPVAINLFNLPQMLLAGVFFPVDYLPRWLQVIGNNLPLAYLNTAMRKVANDGASLVAVGPYVLGMVAWGVVAYLLAAWVFKSE